MALQFDKRVIPVLVQKTEMPSAEDLPEPLKPLAGRQAFQLTHERFNDDVQRFIKELEGTLAEAEENWRRVKAAADEARHVAEQERKAKEAEQDPLSAKAQEVLKRLGRNLRG